jgi:hypothetical protein
MRMYGRGRAYPYAIVRLMPAPGKKINVSGWKDVSGEIPGARCKSRGLQTQSVMPSTSGIKIPTKSINQLHGWEESIVLGFR